MSDTAEERWIGVAELCQRPGVEKLGPNRGGIVAVVLFARDRIAFEERIRRILSEMGFDLVRLNDVDLYAQRMSTHEIDQSIRTAADRLDPASRDAVAFGTFNTFPLD